MLDMACSGDYKGGRKVDYPPPLMGLIYIYIYKCYEMGEGWLYFRPPQTCVYNRHCNRTLRLSICTN